MSYRVGIIGTGPKERTKERGGGFAIGRVHAEAWAKTNKARLAAACDINPENLHAFATDYSVGETYTDYRDMLKNSKLDIVDICTWPPLHSVMVIAAAEAGVKGIYCEKPMCLSLHEAKSMLNACREHGTKLVVSHQRRFESRFQMAKAWIKEGKIGKVLEIHGTISGEDADLLSWGTHWFDMFNYLLDDRKAESVFAQTDCSTARTRYGHYVEDCSLVEVTYIDGTRCYLRGNYEFNQPSGIRIIGEKGMIELFDGLRGLFAGEKGWIDSDPGRLNAFQNSFCLAMEELIASIEEDREPRLISGEIACQTTELIMAAYESSLRRARISLPLRQEQFPLQFREEFGKKG